MHKQLKHFPTYFTLLLTLCFSSELSAQTNVQAWGNITGIQLDGQMHRFESSIRVVYGNEWNWERATARERNPTSYQRQGTEQQVRTNIDSLFFTATVKEISAGKVSVSVLTEALKPQEILGSFYHIALPAEDFANAQIAQIEPTSIDLLSYNNIPTGKRELLRTVASGVSITGEDRNFRITSDQPQTIIVKQDENSGDLGIYLLLTQGQLAADHQQQQSFTLEISGEISAEPAAIKLFPQYPGETFLGLGGNFRLQNPKVDPAVIDYSLENLDVRMGRVEMPWELWHPDENVDPLEAARNGELHPHVKASMQMISRLHDMDMPVLLAGWFPPQWAALGEVKRNPRNPDGTYGNALNPEKMEKIYASITSYILYLKEAYGVEVAMFSFNESDLGINVRQTAEEHAALIKGLGAYMKSRGLNTLLLLGDTADANGFDFVNAALDDPETWAYIGAVSFHSWRGWEKQTLLEWYEAADRLDVPLIVGEGSIDAAAWRYPQIFEETHYALEEIKLYVRMMDICQPQAILQWQLTGDYSTLKGGGIFGNDSIPLTPTQRFWNLKQLAETPVGLSILPVSASANNLYTTALGNDTEGQYVVHMVNESGQREVVITGVPEGISRFQTYVTSSTKDMEPGKKVKVKNGEAKLQLDAASFVSLFSME